MIDIKKLREKNSITQRQLAKICNVSLTTIANWESGITTPKEESQKILKKLSEKR